MLGTLMDLWTSYRNYTDSGAQDPQIETHRLHPSVVPSHEARASIYGVSVTCWTLSQVLYKHNLI